ncbi:MAG: UvrD-helicase domain-containing protein, partial [Gammaproteobacteria bacterium]|nr:UvrD-helicase domain-containing protein [Gammaproteobacteria bacterium]
MTSTTTSTSSMKPFDPLGDLPPGTALIEASAGTGKTYTMTSLFLRLLVEQGLAVDQILVVTFTEAATAELRDRVRHRLYRTLRVFRGAKIDDELAVALRRRSVERGTLMADQDRLWAAYTNFDEAAISTIHGFCHRVLRENAFESGVPFDSELIADEESLRDEVVRDFWINELHRARPSYFRFLGKPGPFVVTLDRLHRLAWKVCSPQPMRILPGPPDLTSEGPDEATIDEAIEAAREIWSSGREQALAALRGADLKAPLLKKIDQYAEELDRWLESATAADAGLPECVGRLSSSNVRTNTKVKGTPPEHALFDACERLGSLVQKRVERLTPKALELLLRFIRTVPEELRARKRARHVQSFDDLLFLLAKALRSEAGPALAGALTGRYRAALIDEFQDTDPVQYEIFKRLFVDRIGGGDDLGWLLLIGDPKQAIYSFRGADIYAYLDAARTAGERRFTLETNYRTDARLVDAFNRLYACSPAPFVEAGIDYTRV